MVSETSRACSALYTKTKEPGWRSSTVISPNTHSFYILEILYCSTGLAVVQADKSIQKWTKVMQYIGGTGCGDLTLVRVIYPIGDIVQ